MSRRALPFGTAAWASGLLGLTLALAVTLALPACSAHPGAGSTSQATSLADCPDAGDPPSTLACTGLYTDIASQTIAPGVQAYSPATPLWADGASKNRWFYIPPGTTIDRSDPNEWTFPVGTKAWKEFEVGGQRIETRYFEKKTPTYWVYTTYVWSADESSATQSFGQSLPVTAAPNGTYTVPTPDECDKCHRGRTDRLLGFEEVSLGLPGASGLTLSALATQGLLSPAPPSTSLTIGDDGTGLDAPALGWLHINCGTTCHNENQNASAYGAGMDLRLDPTLLDGQPASSYDALKTTIGVPASSPSFDGADRIVPGDPTDSVLMQLITIRGPSDQMPPIASVLVDDPDTANVRAWIAKMPHKTTEPPDAGHDAGERDSGTGVAMDAGHEGKEAGTVAEAGAGADSAVMAVDAAAEPPDATAAAADATVPQADAAVDAAAADAPMSATDAGAASSDAAADAPAD